MGPELETRPPCLTLVYSSKLHQRFFTLPQFSGWPGNGTGNRNRNHFLQKPNEEPHFLRGRSLKGRCNIRMYVPVCVCVCVCVCVRLCVCVCPSALPLTPPMLWDRAAEPPPPPQEPSPPAPNPYAQAIVRPRPGKNYP